MKKVKILLVAMMVLPVVFWSCKKKQDEIKIGVIMSLTGAASDPGKKVLQGVELAFLMYNDTAKVKMKLIVEDSKSNNKDGVSAMNKLISTDKVKIVIGDLMSSVFLSCAPIAERNKVVMMSPGASNPAIREAGDYIFSNYLLDDFDGKVMANYVYKVMDKKNVVVLTVNSDYGIGVHKAFVDNFTNLGGTILLEERYEQGQIAFRNSLIKIKNLKPDVVYIAGYAAELGNIVKQMKEYNTIYPIAGNVSFGNDEFINIAKNSFDSIIFSTPYYNPQSKEAHVVYFVKEYEKRYFVQPDIAVAYGYDAANIFIKSILDTNYNLDRVKDNLYTIADYNGVTGKTTFESDGSVLKDIYIKQLYGDGRVKIIEQYFIER